MTDADAKQQVHPGSHQRSGSTSRTSSQQTWRYAVAGLSASLVGLGLARFSYTPLIPALIAAKWFDPSDVVYLGAANLAGYLAGALAARTVAARIGAVRGLRTMMLLATLSFFASSTPVSFTWFFAWRFLSGLTGGIIMVLVASVILPHISAARRGIVGGVIFAGVGLGVAASGTLVPLLLQQGLQQSWYGLGVLAGTLTLVSWWNWPAEAKADTVSSQRAKHASPAARGLLVQYGLNAVALVPHMVFIVDFVARGLGQGIVAGSHYWVLYGLGAIVGPVVTGHLGGPRWVSTGAARRLPDRSGRRVAPDRQYRASPADRIERGGRRLHTWHRTLVLGRIHELVPLSAEQQLTTWSHAATSFALFQAAAAYGFSWIYAQTGGDYLVLFALGGGAVVLALAIDLALPLATRKA